MDIYLLLICILALYKIKFKKNTEYLTINRTACINGIFILLVFFRHIKQYVTYEGKFDTVMMYLDSHLSQLIVVMFLFYSGYGISESIKNKPNYIRKIPTKRILNTWVQFAICVFLFLIVNLCMGKEMGIKKVLLSFVGWDSIGNSNWYIFAMLFFWLFTYLAFTVCNKKFVPYILVLVLTLIYIWTLMYFGKPNYWYNTAIVYWVGMVFSYFKGTVEKVLNNNICFIISVFLCTGGIVFLYPRRASLPFFMIMSVLFSVLIVTITSRVCIENKVLLWLGKNLFGLYILQRIPMMIFSKVPLLSENIAVYTVICFVSMIVVGGLFNKLYGSLKNKIIKTEKNPA